MGHALMKPKPRNPWVVAALRRKAGAHKASAGGLRRRGKVMLRREADALFRPSP